MTKLMYPDLGPYTLADTRAIFSHSVMQLAGGACLCANGDIIVYYNRLTDAIPGNESHFLRSGDGGISWEATALPIASRYEEGAVHVASGMVALENGTVLLPFVDYQSGRTSSRQHHKFLKDIRRSSKLRVAVSRDHVHHWDEMVDVDLPFDFVYPYGKLFRAMDNALCLPTLISTSVSDNWLDDGSASGFLVSRDEGCSWGQWHAIVPQPNRHACVETTVTRCADGSLLALHRNNEPTLLSSHSMDDGMTWSDPEPTNLHGECSCVIQDAKGRLVAAYRSHRNAPAAVPVGMIVVVSEDHGRTWTPEVILPDPKGRLHESFHETGMPDMVLLPTGRVGIVYYSYDPQLSYCPPVNDTAWDSLKHAWKRYLVMAILEEKQNNGPANYVIY